MDWIKQNRVSLASMMGIVVAGGAVWIVTGTSDGTDATPSRSLATARKIKEVQPTPAVRRDPRPVSPKPPAYVRNIRRGDDRRDPIVRKRPSKRTQKRQPKRKLVPGC